MLDLVPKEALDAYSAAPRLLQAFPSDDTQFIRVLLALAVVRPMVFLPILGCERRLGMLTITSHEEMHGHGHGRCGAASATYRQRHTPCSQLPHYKWHARNCRHNHESSPNGDSLRKGGAAYCLQPGQVGTSGLAAQLIHLLARPANFGSDPPKRHRADNAQGCGLVARRHASPNLRTMRATSTVHGV